MSNIVPAGNYKPKTKAEHWIKLRNKDLINVEAERLEEHDGFMVFYKDAYPVLRINKNEVVMIESKYEYC